MGTHWAAPGAGASAEGAGLAHVHRGGRPASRRLGFLPGLSLCSPERFALPENAAAIAVDVSSPDRLGKAEALYNAADRRWVIDHHGTNPHFGQINWVEGDVPATGILVNRLYRAMNAPLTKEAAVCLYTALSTDTGNFVYDSVNGECFEMMAGLMEAGLPLAEVSRVLFREKREDFVRLLGVTLPSLRVTEGGSIAGLCTSLEHFRQNGLNPAETERCGGLCHRHSGRLHGLLSARAGKKRDEGQLPGTAALSGGSGCPAIWRRRPSAGGGLYAAYARCTGREGSRNGAASGVGGAKKLMSEAKKPLCGFLNILKPPGMTSSQVVGYVRWLLNGAKVGHGGTLDPEASGVLPLMIGKAARLFDYMQEKEKVYVTEVAFGAATDTQDAQGRVIASGENYPDEAALREVIFSFTGQLWQRPPMYSALKQDGQRLYELARKGRTAEIPKREVTVHSLELQSMTENHGALLKVRCSKGFYVRTLCNDLGEALNCPAHMRFLLRAESGVFTLQTAVTLERLRQAKESDDLRNAAAAAGNGAAASAVAGHARPTGKASAQRRQAAGFCL